MHDVVPAPPAEKVPAGQACGAAAAVAHLWPAGQSEQAADPAWAA